MTSACVLAAACLSIEIGLRILGRDASHPHRAITGPSRLRSECGQKKIPRIACAGNSPVFFFLATPVGAGTRLAGAVPVVLNCRPRDPDHDEKHHSLDTDMVV